MENKTCYICILPRKVLWGSVTSFQSWKFITCWWNSQFGIQHRSPTWLIHVQWGNNQLQCTDTAAARGRFLITRHVIDRSFSINYFLNLPSYLGLITVSSQVFFYFGCVMVTSAMDQGSFSSSITRVRSWWCFSPSKKLLTESTDSILCCNQR